ncbi:PLP-dependent transferase, partial [Bradyrhizobium sp. NBAIM20]|uniref:PLP-dependent transferase n=1 Tax=Bradyrhizobium sp. NBAIM20 TaxID=2793811 RepID=UPI00320A5A39
MATLEHAEHCLLLPSGLAAVTLVSLALLRPGDEVLVPDNVYGQNRYLTESWLPQWGVTHRFYDPLTVPELRENTKLVWLEAAG